MARWQRNLFSGERKSERNEESLSGKLIVSVAVVSMHSPLSLLLIVSGFENPDYGRDLHMQINITSRESFPPEIWKSWQVLPSASFHGLTSFSCLKTLSSFFAFTRKIPCPRQEWRCSCRQLPFLKASVNFWKARFDRLCAWKRPQY